LGGDVVASAAGGLLLLQGKMPSFASAVAALLPLLLSLFAAQAELFPSWSLAAFTALCCFDSFG